MRTSQIFRIHKTKRIKTIGHSRLQGHVQHSSRQCDAGMLVGQPGSETCFAVFSILHCGMAEEGEKPRRGITARRRRNWGENSERGGIRSAGKEHRDIGVRPCAAWRELRKRRETGDCEETLRGRNWKGTPELRRELRKRETGDCEETTRSSSVRCVVLGCARSWAEPEEASLFIFCIFGRGGCGPVWPPCSSLCGMPWEKRHALVASLSEELGQVHE